MRATCLANHIFLYLIVLTILDVEYRTSFLLMYVVETDKGPCCQKYLKVTVS
jgi:hypothetical protein